MSTQEGLSRRRTAATSGTNGARSAVPTLASRTDRQQIVNGDHVVAYDARDLRTTEEDYTPKLTLLEEVLLLGLKDRQGHLSFWNDNISYTLRGCILIELALRQRIAMVKNPNRNRFPLADRYIEVIDDTLTGEVILDEAMKLMKMSEPMSVGLWIDLFSGETWNVMKIGYQLKQVRERLAKGLVDKGILRTEKRNFLLFDMATHPLADVSAKEDTLRRTLSLLTNRTAAVHLDELYPSNIRFRTIRTVALTCAAFAASVLENALVHLHYNAREAAFAKCDDLLSEFSLFPFGSRRENSVVAVGTGSRSYSAEIANIAEIGRLARAEIQQNPPGEHYASKEAEAAARHQRELCMEVVAAACEIFHNMDSLL